MQTLTGSNIQSYVALYENNKLNAVRVYEVDPAAGEQMIPFHSAFSEENNIDEYLFIDGGQTIKAFIWDADLLMPLSEPYGYYSSVGEPRGVDEPTIFIIGDSTAASYAQTRAPLTGWGQVFDQFFPGNVTISNFAQSGRSSKSFINEGFFDRVKAKWTAGDYLFISFGGNDAKEEDPNRYTDPNQTSSAPGSFKYYLKEYIDAAKAANVTPVLVTQYERSLWNGGTFVPNMGRYPDATRELAEELGVVLLDMNADVNIYFPAIGKTATDSLFMMIPPGHPNYPDGYSDTSHLNYDGAIVTARMILSRLAETGLPIAEYVQGVVSPLE
jgi:lysophospholipase L1-like esterase